MTDAPSAGTATVSRASVDPRAERVAAAVKLWQRTLVDLGGRNTLLWYRDLAAGTMDLTTAHPGGVSMLLAGKQTRLSDLFRESSALEDARHRARAIRAKTLELQEERGIVAGFVAIGMATWTVPRAARPPAAPVLLRTCVLRPTGVAQQDFAIVLGPEAELNPVLREYLRSEQGIEIDAEALADLAEVGNTFDPYPSYAALTHACAAVPDFGIAPRLVIGTFSYAKLPMVADLALQGETLADHDVVAALAGDESALAAVRLRVPESDPDPDPEREHLVLDADSSQQAAIDAVRAGAHLVIKGPPGTGKSQTIANLVAALAAEGKSVLFVAEKRAAIDAVVSRLERLGLGELVLDAHDGTTNRRAIAKALVASLDAALEHRPPTSDPTADALRDRRSRLVRHLKALHRTRDPWGVSAHEVQEAMTELATRRPAPTSHVRLTGPDILGLTRTRAVELGRRLRDAAGLGAWTPDGDDPWFGARILTSSDAARALDITTRLSATELAETADQLNAILSESHVPEANSFADWQSAFGTMTRVRHTLEVFRPQVFDVPLTEPIAATATRQWRLEHDTQMGWLARWRVARQTKRLLRPGRPPANLHEELVAANEQRDHWAALVGGGGRPEISPRLDEGTELLERVVADLDWLTSRLAPGLARGGAPDGAPAEVGSLSASNAASPGEPTDLLGMPLADLRERLAALAARPERLAALPNVTGALDEVRAAGLGAVIDDLAARGVAAEGVPAEVEHVWWASLAQDITVRDPDYGAHDGAGLRRAVDEYVAADHAHLAATVERVRSAVARNVREVISDNPAHEALVRAEAGRSRRHKALRDLVPQAGRTLTAIKPCWAMSPLVVASTLPPGRLFDVVIFDEASQIQPAQAVSAISRGRQVVVAGDERQLPPTNFFTVVSDDEPTPGQEVLTDGFESILDVLAAALPTRQLTWHYRSRDERLIAFANEAMYDGTLTTFPGTSLSSAVCFEPVDGQATVQHGVQSIETTQSEVDRVVELVLEHARTRPDETLGVIALGITHALRLEEAVTAALRDEPDLAAFFSDDRDERFFVKNLERVQGDERDAIILSIGYGKTPHGRVLHRFGPLNVEGGERRLNVAMTRARRRMTVVSALRAADLDPARLKSRGTNMLRDFLAYAESGGAVVGVAAGAAAPAPDPLRHDLAERLRRAGLTVHESLGSGSQRIDLAVEDPYHRGRGLLAVESDGPAYAAHRSTRERDRLRAEQLGRLGWRHVRVWSTDLFRDPAREISRIVSMAKDQPFAPRSRGSQGDLPRLVDGVGGNSLVDDRAPDGEDPDGEGHSRPESEPTATSATAGRKRRRVFRKGTGAAASMSKAEGYGPTQDDLDLGWDEGRDDGTAREQWLREQRPPHYD
ncbi:MAG: AAA domain-containing protein [Intrasporangium sp.]|uniref:AAA domain-containing protein n=1 Tax=Intrasporangium sp. TaxID=1925024 RepID=UPI0026486308|nr:AAA domain-containing protein [Intrasporangium sp.]MDN5797180.1 AAA domain-containing protein [Intrasporangium sp.]